MKKREREKKKSTFKRRVTPIFVVIFHPNVKQSRVRKLVMREIQKKASKKLKVVVMAG